MRKYLNLGLIYYIMLLDLLDKKILFELEKDSSIPVSILAKKIKRSKESVNYRINRLKERNILRNCTAIVDMSKLGYLTFRVYIQWQNMTLQLKEQFYKDVGMNENIWTTTELHGKWDFAFFIGIKRDEYIEKFHKIWNNLMSKYKPLIANYKIAIYAPVYNFNKRFFYDDKTMISRIYGEGGVVEHDELDETILPIYSSDVRQSLVTIAKQAKTSIETVRRRIRELERKKVIVGYKIDLNLPKLGFQGYRVDFALNSMDRTRELFEYIKYHKHFYQINKSIGGADFECEIVVKDLAHLLEILEDIMQKFKGTVKNYEYMGYTGFPKLSMVPD
jgi:Lrp/AsnC family transcriptional regulator, leucine-responsive regulatory protein